MSVLIVTLFTGLGYAVLTVYALQGRGRPIRRWLAAYLFASALLAAAFFLAASPSPPTGAGLILAGVYLANLILLGRLTIQYIGGGWGAWWLALSLLVGLAALALDYSQAGPSLVERDWLQAMTASPPSLTALTIAGLWAFGGWVLIGVMFFALARARLPLHANRLLFWLLLLPIIMLGEASAAWGRGLLSPVGQGLRFVGAAGVVYAVKTGRLVDVRNLARSSLSISLFVLITAAVTLFGIGLAILLRESLSPAQGLAAIVAVALLVALVYQVLRSSVEPLVNQIVLRAAYDPSRVAREYSYTVATILDIEQLARAASAALSKSIEARHAALLLCTPDDGAIKVRPIGSNRAAASTEMAFSADSPIIVELTRARRPLLQFDVDTADYFQAAPNAERRWLQGLGMDAYAPIMDGVALSGIMAVGPRASGDPYRPRELDVLTTIAEQSSVALKNARLFTDLRALNEQMQALNASLRATNEKLAAMDAAKTDFITIASHELRTPLTQIRGYADVLDTLSAKQTLSAERVHSLTDTILKACDRLDQVIGQMLDASQIDIEAMHLKFVDTSLDAVLRTAVGNFAKAMRERRQTLTAQGVRQMPPIFADYQRLVQAFQHIIGNAVKFTPDGGRIDIAARRLPRDDENPERVEVVVADSGVGIDAQYHSLIFEKFFRVGSTALHSTGATKFMGAGPGLGLPIARGIIQGHGGKIWVESPGFDAEKFPGSRFHIVLPLRPPPIAPGANGLEVGALSAAAEPT